MMNAALLAVFRRDAFCLDPWQDHGETCQGVLEDSVDMRVEIDQS